jgi:hypothetical protein
MDESWVAKIRQQKFQWHNSEWLQLISQEADEKGASSPGHRREESFEDASHQSPTSRDTMKRPIKNTQRKPNFEYEMESDDEDFGFQIGGTNALLDGPL